MNETKAYSPQKTSSAEEAWKRIKKRINHMTREKKLQTFVDAGILTKNGNAKKPYRGVFVKAKG